jgi:uncharacterized Tic20 family protein
MDNQGGWGQPPQGQQPGYGPQAAQGWGAPAAQGSGQTAPGTGWYAQNAAAAGPLTEEDKQNAFYAHLFAALANWVTCGAAVPIAAPFIVVMMDKRKHPFTLFHVNQSLIFQAVLFGINAALAILFTILSVVTCGIGSFLFLLTGVIPIIAGIYPILVGLKAKEGQWESYPMIGEKVLAAQSPLIK